MNKLLLTILFLGLLSFSPPAGKTFEERLLGSWTTGANGIELVESWERVTGDHLSGKGRSTGFDKVVIEEELNLVKMKGRWVYIAMPAGEATAFTQTMQSEPDSMVFSNSEHDFPQQIIYCFKSDTELKVRLQGKVKGKLEYQEFSLSRKKD